MRVSPVAGTQGCTLGFMPAACDLPVEGDAKDPRHQDYEARSRQGCVVDDVSGALHPEGEADHHCNLAAQDQLTLLSIG